MPEISRFYGIVIKCFLNRKNMNLQTVKETNKYET